MCYVAAGNERIKNEGEITFDFESLKGLQESFVLQIAEVNKALGFGAYMVDPLPPRREANALQVEATRMDRPG